MDNIYLWMALMYLVIAVFTTAQYIPQKGLLLGKGEASLNPKKAARRYLLVKVLGGMLYAAMIWIGIVLVASILGLIVVGVLHL